MASDYAIANKGSFRPSLPFPALHLPSISLHLSSIFYVVIDIPPIFRVTGLRADT